MADDRRPRTLMGHADEISAIAITLDGQRIVTGSWDGTARVWDTASGRQLLLLKGHTDRVWSVGVTPDGRRFVTGSDDGTARIWDAVSGRQLLQINGDAGGIRGLAVTPDGKRLLTGSGTKAHLWDLASGRRLLELDVKVFSTFVRAVAVTPDGRRLVTAEWGGRIKLWDAASGRELISLPTDAGGITSVVVTPDGRRLVTGCGDGTAKLWDASTGRKLFTLEGHTMEVSSVAVTPDGQRIVTGSKDGTTRLWDAVSGRELPFILKDHTGRIRSVAVTPDGRRIIAGTSDGTVLIWQAASQEQVELWDQQERETERRRAAWQWPLEDAPGFIHDWLVLAPLPLTPKRGETGVDWIEHQQLPGEARLQPRAGQHVSVNGQDLIWQAYHEEDPVLNFNPFRGKSTEFSAAYAVCYVISATERQDLLLQVGNDQQAKVYLNGQEVYKGCRAHNGLDPIGPVALHKGINVLVSKVVHEFGGGWAGCLRFVDAKDNPADGLRFSSTPEP